MFHRFTLCLMVADMFLLSNLFRFGRLIFLVMNIINHKPISSD
jgi:hypothetical protein